MNIKTRKDKIISQKNKQTLFIIKRTYKTGKRKFLIDLNQKIIRIDDYLNNLFKDYNQGNHNIIKQKI